MSVQSPLPPPPPPPPPLSHSPSPRLSSISPNHQPSAIIKPTTAGLLKFPSIQNNDHEIQQELSSNSLSLPANNLSSQKFKDELREKHSHFSNNNSSSNIDERIKSRKERINNELIINPSSLTNEQQQLVNMPDKLLSTLSRQDVKPFSYISGVNDPNNRGKLDLNQIKSPVMRRRLLANLDSDEREDEEVDIVASGANIVTNDLFLPECATIQYFAPKPVDNCINTNNQSQNITTPVMQYNQPPLFYNLREPQSTQTGYSNGVTRPKSAIDELGDEVARSLDSLSELVANLQTSPSPGTINHQQPVSTSRRMDHMRESNHLSPDDQRRSTFLPSDIYNRHNDSMRQTSSSPGRSMGDYLLSPDSNYFSTNSTAQPYSISPYYGSPLDFDPYDQSFYPQARPISGRTFSPNGANSSICNSSQKRYY